MRKVVDSIMVKNLFRLVNKNLKDRWQLYEKNDDKKPNWKVFFNFVILPVMTRRYTIC